jgi:hypothetical protein
MVKELYKTINGLTDSSIESEGGNLLVLPTAAGGVLTPGIKVQEIMAMSRLGEVVIVDTYPIERKPEVKLEFSQKNIQLLSMRLGLAFETETTSDCWVVHNGLLVTKLALPAVGEGYEGYGMVADQAGSKAFLLQENGQTIALTRQPYDTFNGAAPLTFAQGQHCALKFSDDLDRKYVAYKLPHALSNVLALSETPNTNFKMVLMTIMNDRSLLQWDFPSVSVKLDQGDINMAEAKMELTFYVQDDGSSCLPFSIKYKGKAQRRHCVAGAA